MHNYIELNQGLGCCALALRTSFSTVCVKSSWPCSAASLQFPGENTPRRSAAGEKSEQGRALPKIHAEDFFFLKSMALRRRKALPHNFVHRKCEETHTPLSRRPKRRSRSPRRRQRHSRQMESSISAGLASRPAAPAKRTEHYSISLCIVLSLLKKQAD